MEKISQITNQNQNQNQEEMNDEELKIFQMVEKKLEQTLILNNGKSLIDIYEDINENHLKDKELIKMVQEIQEKPYALISELEKQILENEKDIAIFNTFDKKIENAYLKAEQTELKYEKILYNTNVIIEINKRLHKKIDEMSIDLKEVKEEIKNIKKIDLIDKKENIEKNTGTSFFKKLFKIF